LRAITPQGVEYKIKYFLDPRIAGPGRARHEVLRSVMDQLHRAGLQPATPQQDVFHAPFVARHLDTHAQNDRALLLERTELFQNLTPAERGLLAGRMQERLFKEGAVLLRRGDAGDSMFVVCEGLLNVMIPAGPAQTETRVARLPAGSYFGEMSAFTGEPRSATIVAATDALVFEIAKSDVAGLLSTRPELAEMIAQTITARRSSSAEAVRRASQATPIEEERSKVAQLLGRMLTFFGMKPKPVMTTQELADNSAQSPFG
jgi:CRP-like cAMP-binding protein